MARFAVEKTIFGVESDQDAPYSKYADTNNFDKAGGKYENSISRRFHNGLPAQQL